jgi:membrane fusion protein (multidrug efflux system)
MALYPSVKNSLLAPDLATGDGASAPEYALRRAALNINAEIVKQQALVDKIIRIGTTLPDEEVDLSFESSGKVTAIYFREGAQVKGGDLLAKINDQPLQAQLRKLEAELPLARDRVYRQRTLLEKDAVSQEAYEQVSTEYEKLLADIELVRSHIAQTELRASFDGVIGLRSVSEGAFATPATVIAKLTRITPLKIEFSVPERYASDIAQGTPITFTLESADGVSRKRPATVYAVESKLDMETHSLRVRATYPNEDGAIQPGRYVSVEVTKQEIRDALAIPSESIIPEMGKNIVYLFKDGRAQPVEIATGLRTESHVQVQSGLTPGDTLITTGVMQLRTDMEVVIDQIN